MQPAAAPRRTARLPAVLASIALGLLPFGSLRAEEVSEVSERSEASEASEPSEMAAYALIRALPAEPGEGKQGHTGIVRSLRFHPESGHLISGSADGTLRRWDPTRGEEVARFSLAEAKGPVP